MKTLVPTWIVILVVITSISLMAAGQQPGPAQAQRQTQQTMRIAITTNGFEPASINLKPNVPAKVTFIRQTDQTCAKSVVIPEYKINQELPLNKPIVVTFTPTKTGEFGSPAA